MTDKIDPHQLEKKLFQQLLSAEKTNIQRTFVVYHDENFYIKCLSPNEDLSMADKFEHKILTYDDVLPYLSGEEDLFNAKLVLDDRTGKYNIFRYDPALQYVIFNTHKYQMLKTQTADYPYISVTQLSNNVIEFKLENLNQVEAGAYQTNQKIYFYVTPYLNPNFLLETIVINLTELIANKTINTNYNLNNKTIYMTTGIIKGHLHE
jgi:hypothetical protein